MAAGPTENFHAVRQSTLVRLLATTALVGVCSVSVLLPGQSYAQVTGGEGKIDFATGGGGGGGGYGPGGMGGLGGSGTNGNGGNGGTGVGGDGVAYGGGGAGIGGGGGGDPEAGGAGSGTISTITNTGAISGGGGGNYGGGGGAGIGGGGGDSSGGAAGGAAGFKITNATVANPSITNSGTISGGPAGPAGSAGGGDGIGNGGTASAGPNGAGGAGGAGLNNLVIVNTGTGTIQGGNGGGGGAGGAGISGSGMTVVNGGTISGGLAGNGVTQADSLRFTAGTNNLTLSYGGKVGMLNGDIAVTGTLRIDPGTPAGKSVTLGNLITDDTGGAGAVTKIGVGTLVLSGANSYTGATTVSAGILNIQNATALGTTAGGTTVSSGATLQIQGGIAVGAEALSLSGLGSSGSNGALESVSGTNGYAGAITLAATSSVGVDADALTLSGKITAGTYNLSKVGDGTLTLTGAMSGGSLVVNQGTLVLDTTGTLTTTGEKNPASKTDTATTQAVDIASGATFTNNGTVSITAAKSDGIHLQGGTFSNAGSVKGAVWPQSGVYSQLGGTIDNTGSISGGYGVYFNAANGGGANNTQSLTITGDGSITGNGGGAGNGGAGIFANTNTGTITLGKTGVALGTITGTGSYGIVASTTTGAIGIDVGGTGKKVTSTTTDAIHATTTTGPITIVVEPSTMITGASDGGANQGAGISAQATGKGDVSITLGDNVTVKGDKPGAMGMSAGGNVTFMGGNGDTVSGTSGIVNDQMNAAGGLSTIQVGTTGTITAKGTDTTDAYQGNGVFNGNQGTGTTTVTTGSGTTVTGSNGVFLAQTSTTNGSAATVSVGGTTTGNGTVTTTAPAAYRNRFTGTGVTLNANGVPQGVGVAAYNNGSGLLTVTGAGNITGSTVGILAQTGAGGTGDLTVSGAGTTSGTAGAGIDARIRNAASGGDLLVDRSGAITAGTIGIDAITAGKGTVTVTTGVAGSPTANTVSTTNGSGIVATATSGAVAVTAHSNVTAGGAGNSGVFLTGNAATNIVTVDAGATVKGAIGLQVAGTGTTTFANSGTVATTATNGNALQIGTGSTLAIGDQFGTVTGNIQLVAASSTLNFTETTSNITLPTQIIYGAGTVNQNGTQSVTLGYTNTTPANNFTGTINVNSGTLAVNGVVGDVRTVNGNTATLNVNNGGTLAGTGTFAGSATVNSGGTISPGASGVTSQGTLTIAQDLTLKTGSTTVFNLGQSTYVGGMSNDLIEVGRTLQLGGTLDLDDTSGTPIVTGVYRLFDYNTANKGGTVSGSFGTINVAAGSTARVSTAIADQVNVFINNGSQIMQLWDGTDTKGVPGGAAGAQGGNGTWNTANTNWTYGPGGEINDSWQKEVGVFGGTAGTVTVAGSQDFQGLQFATTGYVLTGGTINATGNPFGTAGSGTTPETRDLSFLNVTAALATINSNITGSATTAAGAPAGIDKLGSGTLRLGGTDSYGGRTRVDTGVLELTATGSITASSTLLNLAGVQLDAGSHATFGTGNVTNTATGNIGVFNGATMSGVVASNAGVIGNAGTWNNGTVQANTGTIVNAVGTWTGNFTNNNGGTIDLVSGTLAGDLTNGGSVVAYGGLISGAVNNGGTLTVDKATTLTPASLGIAANTPASAALTGRLANTGTLTVDGAVTNSGTISVFGTLNAPAGLTNTSTGTVNNSGTINDALNNAGTVNNNAGATYNADVASNTGTINNAGTWNTKTAVGFNTSGVLNTTGTLNAFANGGALNNTGTVNAQGTIHGPINNNAGAFNLTGTLTGNAAFTNLNGATLNVDGNTYTGVTTVDNFGTVNLGGGTIVATTAFDNENGSVLNSSGGTITAPTFTNAGRISMANGYVGDVTRINGNYVATGNASLAVDVDLRNTAPKITDQLVVNGTVSGNTQVNFFSPQFAAPSRINPAVPTFVGGTLIPTTPVVISNGGSGTFVPAQGQGNIFATNGGLVQYSLQQTSPGNYAIVSGANTGAITPIATSLSSAFGAISTSFFQSSSAFVVPASGNGPDQRTYGPWIRVSGGAADISSTGTDTQLGQSAKSLVDTTFEGFQAGFDSGVINVDRTNTNLHIGLTTGIVGADATEKKASNTDVNFSIPFVGIYGALKHDDFSADVTYRHDFVDLRVNGLAVPQATNIHADGDSVYGNLLYGIAAGKFSIIPSLGMGYSHYDIDNLPTVLGGNIAFRNFDSLLGRLGVQVGRTVAVTDKFAIQPFITGAVWHEFEGDTLARFTDPSGLFDQVLTTRVGTFGQVGVGMSAQLVPVGFTGFIRGDFRFGDKLNGQVGTLGVRYSF